MRTEIGLGWLDVRKEILVHGCAASEEWWHLELKAWDPNIALLKHASPWNNDWSCMRKSLLKWLS